MTSRMTAALLALFGLFVSLYLMLYKVGMISQISCSIGSCETVQMSRWASLFGLPVAAWGVGFYVSVLAVALLGLQERFWGSRSISIALLALTGWGVLFSAWLTYLELFVINAICTWCVVSAVVVLALFAVAWWDWRTVRRGPAPGNHVTEAPEDRLRTVEGASV